MDCFRLESFLVHNDISLNSILTYRYLGTYIIVTHFKSNIPTRLQQSGTNLPTFFKIGLYKKFIQNPYWIPFNFYSKVIVI